MNDKKAKATVSEAQKIADEFSKRQRAMEAVLSAVEASAVHGMALTTLRALKVGRPFKIRPTGISPKGMAGFTFSDDCCILIGKQLLESGFPNKLVTEIVAKLGRLEYGLWENLLLVLLPSGDVLHWPSSEKIMEMEEKTLVGLLSNPNKSCLLNLKMIGEKVIEMRRAFLECRDYQEPECIREAREKTVNGLKKLLADPSLKFAGVGERK